MRTIRDIQRQYWLARRRPMCGRLLVRSRPRPLWIRLVMLVLIGGTTTLAGMLIWSGVSWIVDPYRPNWLVQTFPSWFTSDYRPIQTLAEMAAELSQSGLMLGEPVVWQSQSDAVESTADLIFPVLQASSDSGGDPTLVELRIYRPQGRTSADQVRQFQLTIDPVPVQPPQLSVVAAPLANTALSVAASNQKAPFSRLSLFPNPLGDADWILLSGSQTRGKLEIAYGQLLHYSPRSAQFNQLLTWTSPAGKVPIYQALDGNGPPELLVEQTVGLEPQLQAYRLNPGQPPIIERVSLSERVIDQPPGSLYDKGLLLARSGLWSPALQIMRTAKERLGSDWKPAAEAQIGLIAAHAEVARDQSQRTWSRLDQQVLANLLDGRWTEALNLLEANPGTYDSLRDLLKADANRLQPRFRAFDQAYPNVAEAQIWAALMIVAQADDDQGKAWLAQRTADPAIRDRFQKILTRAAGLPILSAAPRFSHLMGSARPAQATDTWLTPAGQPAVLKAGQTWYDVAVTGLYASQWQSPATAALPTEAKSLWATLGLADQPQLWLITPDHPTQPLNLTVSGYRRLVGELRLLATGPALAETANSAQPPIAITPGSLQRIETLPGAPLSQLLAANEPWRTVLYGRLVELLGESAIAPAAQIQTYPLDMTGDGQPEMLLSLDSRDFPEAFPTPTSQPRTLIFTLSGNLLYDDLTQPQTVIGFSQPLPTSPAALLLQQEAGYSLYPLPSEH
ncbi:hypothetical protein IQ241_23315 [Romeria aff. gracilis LEGE 07310]|uniref:Uncharacterized protein n=1 Tax=Vasconcelosia minhoensis LEGE 07310 TaxID=915328 RepID=A0A8J7DNR1_9CYAN|nr:hypothetical protein [Romeria gracilis]MBE9080181.1 hypothetical protein [Romeria aff. gracilis LEGE 07310]